ncbi:hemolysin family protein [Synechococcus elongatus]|uniref:Hemolysin family protein n=1 Tax=Synechococcus elongatus PCC 11801 TaxID=2219813 RepID=A0AAN1UTK6_SYNEL|nr:hemolysin family protein [Synechococcus elongatus]AZB71659.1 HlyC/CorC family transporter [Synechococcus elongatus PCC 11801]
MLSLAIATLVVLIGSALCSASEAALLSLPLIRVRQLAESRRPAALALLAIKEQISRPLATLVVLNNLFNILGSIIIGSLAAQVLQSAWIGVFSAVLTLLIILFGEIVPKTLGTRFAQTLSLISAQPLRWLTRLLLPIIWLLEHFTAPFNEGSPQLTTDEQEIQLLASIGHQEGAIEQDELEMIQRVFQLNDLNASDVMTPRVAITYLWGEDQLETVKAEILASQHSRIVIVDDSIDAVSGIALKTELLAALLAGQGNLPLSALARPAHFVPETVRADKLLKTFQKVREHLFIVLDEYGGVAGVVTLEDVLEVLTGEIVDETDRNVDLRAIARFRRRQILHQRGLDEA